MANSIKINFECIIDIPNELDRCDKVYPLQHCHYEPKITKLKLKRSYKALCQICNRITSTYNKDRIAICFDCERHNILKTGRKNLLAICYNCNKTVMNSV